MPYTWDHVYTDDDVIKSAEFDFICPFRSATLERLRLVFPNIEPDDLWLSRDTTPDELRAALWSAYGTTSGVHAENNMSAYMEKLTFTLPVPFPPPRVPVYGSRFEPGHRDPFTWYGMIGTFPDILTGGSAGANEYAARSNDPVFEFNWVQLQLLVTMLSYYFVAPGDYDGYDPADRLTKMQAFADTYFPTTFNGGGSVESDLYFYFSGLVDLSNPRAIFKAHHGWFGNDENDDPILIGSHPSHTLPTLGWNHPAWPTANGWTRKREREITSLAAAGTDGQRVRFIVAIGAAGASGIQAGPFDTGASNATPSAHTLKTWVIDRKPLLSDVQAPSLPATPDDEIQYDGLTMLRQDGEWVVDADQETDPDRITLYGFMQPGDIVGPWLFNELHDAINQLTHTQARCDIYYTTDAEDAPFRIRTQTGAGINYFNRGVGFHWDPSFGPRTAHFYATGQAFEDGVYVPGYLPWDKVADEANPYACTLESEDVARSYLTGIGTDRTFDFVAVVDHSPSLQYRADNNPPICPPPWPLRGEGCGDCPPATDLPHAVKADQFARLQPCEPCPNCTGDDFTGCLTHRGDGTYTPTGDGPWCIGGKQVDVYRITYNADTCVSTFEIKCGDIYTWRGKKIGADPTIGRYARQNGCADLYPGLDDAGRARMVLAVTFGLCDGEEGSSGEGVGMDLL